MILAAGNMHVRLRGGSKERSTVRITRAEPRVRWKDLPSGSGERAVHPSRTQP